MAEWVVRTGTVVVTIAQMLVKNSHQGMYCTHTTRLLRLESEWLSILIYMQVLKVVLFTVWQIKIVEDKEI